MSAKKAKKFNRKLRKLFRKAQAKVAMRPAAGRVRFSHSKAYAL